MKDSRQLGDLPNMIQPPLLGVVNAASAVSARTLTCRGPAVPRSCSMLSVYIAAFDAVPLECFQEELSHGSVAIVGVKDVDVLRAEPGPRMVKKLEPGLTGEVTIQPLLSPRLDFSCAMPHIHRSCARKQWRGTDAWIGRHGSRTSRERLIRNCCYAMS